MSDQPDQPPSRPHDPVPPGWAAVQPPPAGGWGEPAQPAGWGQPPPPPGWGQQPKAPGWAPQGASAWAPPPKPGVIPLRPLGVGELLDGAIAAIRRDPKLMLGISALVVTVATVLQSLVTWLLLGESATLLTEPGEVVTEDELLSFAGGGLLTLLISLVISLLTQVVLTGILTFSVSKAVLGEDSHTGEAWRATRGRLPALLGLILLVFAVIAAAVTLLLLPGILAIAAGADVAAVLLLLVGAPLALVVGVAIWVLTWFGAPVLILERQPVVPALRRAVRLARPSFWRVLGLWLLLQLLVAVFAGILSGPLALVSGMVFDDPFGLPSLSVQAVGTILASTVTLPFAAAVTVLVYVDQRIRREALDLELARAAGLQVPGQAATPGTAPAPGGPSGPPGWGPAGPPRNG